MSNENPTLWIRHNGFIELAPTTDPIKLKTPGIIMYNGLAGIALAGAVSHFAGPRLVLAVLQPPLQGLENKYYDTLRGRTCPAFSQFVRLLFENQRYSHWLEVDDDMIVGNLRLALLGQPLDVNGNRPVEPVITTVL